MNLNEIIDLERGLRSVLIEWLQRCYLLPDPLNCSQCNQALELAQRNDNHVDGFLWSVTHFISSSIYILSLHVTQAKSRE